MIHVSDWSPNGRSLLWTEFHPVTGGEIRVAALDGSSEVRTITGAPFDARGAVFSPDGRWIAYASNETGIDEVYVQRFPGPSPKHQISFGGGHEPVWSPTGEHIFFRGRGRMTAVPVRTFPTFSADPPRPLFADGYEVEHGIDRNYDVSKDGKRFLMLKPARPFDPAEMTVILNWGATLGQTR